MVTLTAGKIDVCLLTLLVWCIWCVTWCMGQQSKNLSMADVLENLFATNNYNPYVHPNADFGEPTVVDIEILLNQLSSFDEEAMDYTAQIILRERWTDQRLTFTAYNHSLVLDQRLFSMMWVPDVFISNSRDGMFHDLTVPNRRLELSQNGQILYSSRLTLKIACEMNLAEFPMDEQTCDMTFESFGYTTKDLILRWNGPRPIKRHRSLSQPDYEVVEISTSERDEVYSTGVYSRLSLNIHMERHLAYYLAQTFIPTILVVILSWVSFWIDINAVPARVSIGLITVLTMTTQSSGISSSLPKVSYVRAIDVWMSTCLAFVFVALLEFAIANVLNTKRAPGKVERCCKCKEEIKQEDEDQGVEPNGGGASLTHGRTSVEMSPAADCQEMSSKELRARRDPCLSSETKEQKKNPFENKARLVDIVSRVLFPLAFLIFNVFYWGRYLHLF